MKMSNVKLTVTKQISLLVGSLLILVIMLVMINMSKVESTSYSSVVDSITIPNTNLKNVTENLPLKNSIEKNGKKYKIVWTSSDEAVVNPNGLVTRPSYNSDIIKVVVTLTATLEENPDSKKVFTVTVPKNSYPMEDVFARIDLPYMDKQFSEINLITEVDYTEKYSVEWFTSDEFYLPIITTNADVSKAKAVPNTQKGNDVDVVLTAKITAPDKTTSTRDYSVTVLGRGYGSDKNPYLIHNEEQFRDIASELSASYEIINNITFTSFKTINGVFRGKINGNNNTLTIGNFSTNTYCPSSANLTDLCIGIFAEVEGAQFTNITFSVLTTSRSISTANVTIFSGLIAGRINSGRDIVLRNIIFTRASGSSALLSVTGGLYNNYIGLVAGNVDAKVIGEDIKVIDNQLNTVYGGLSDSGTASIYSFAGGLFGRTASHIILNRVSITGKVTSANTNTRTGNTSGYAGLIVGLSTWDTNSKLELTNIYGNGTTIASINTSGKQTHYVGGLVGHLQGSTSSITKTYFKGSTETGSFTTTTGREVYMGGIVGYSNSSISDSFSNLTYSAASTDTANNSSHRGYIGANVGYKNSSASYSNNYSFSFTGRCYSSTYCPTDNVVSDATSKTVDFYTTNLKWSSAIWDLTSLTTGPKLF